MESNDAQAISNQLGVITKLLEEILTVAKEINQAIPGDWGMDHE